MQCVEGVRGCDWLYWEVTVKALGCFGRVSWTTVCYVKLFPFPKYVPSAFLYCTYYYNAPSPFVLMKEQTSNAQIILEIIRKTHLPSRCQDLLQQPFLLWIKCTSMQLIGFPPYDLPRCNHRDIVFCPGGFPLKELTCTGRRTSSFTSTLLIGSSLKAVIHSSPSDLRSATSSSSLGRATHRTADWRFGIKSRIIVQTFMNSRIRSSFLLYE